MNIRFWQEYRPEEKAAVLYFLKEEFNSLTGLHYIIGIAPEEVNKRVEIATHQCMEVLPYKATDIYVQVIESRDQLPETAGRQYMLPETSIKMPALEPQEETLYAPADEED
jgi:hypothetical protein